ncbi:ribonuclease H-like domain-containing protein [Tanacetum coccineum]
MISITILESDVKGSTRSSSSAQNVAFVSSESTNSTNDVSITYGVSTSSGYTSQRENSSSYTDELKRDGFKMESGHVSMRLKKFYKNIGRKLQFNAKEPVGFDKTKVECFNCHNTGHFARECRSKGNQESRRRNAGNTRYKAKDNGRRPGKQEEPKALVTIDGDGVDWTGLSKLLKTQMSAKDKSGLRVWRSNHDVVLSYENEVFESVFDSRSSDVEDAPVYDRFPKVKGMHAVPPPMTRNYMPPKSDFGIHDVETLESVPEPVVVEPKVVSQLKVWSDAPIIEEYESDSDDEYLIKPSKEQEKPSFAFVNTVKHVKTPRETVKEQNTCRPILAILLEIVISMRKMAKQFKLNKQKGKAIGQGENRQVWNSVQILNHQNKFVPKAVLTKTGIFPVNAARQNPSSQAAETSTARKVNTARPIVNEIRQRNNFYKSHSPIRRPFNKSTVAKANFTNHKVNTAGDKTISAIRGYRETAVKTSAGCNWRPKRHYLSVTQYHFHFTI